MELSRKITLEDKFHKGAEQLVKVCANLTAGEVAYIIANPETEDVAHYVRMAALNKTSQVQLDIIPSTAMHGSNAPDQVAKNMLTANVIFCLTRMSLAHSEARYEATKRGARFLSLPDYSLEQLSSDALLFDFTSIYKEVEQLGEVLDKGKIVNILSPRGTNLTLEISGRTANRCPGTVHRPGTLGSPPDAEVNIAPLEFCSQGILVVDGSIPCKEVGLLVTPVVLQIKDGQVVNIESDDSNIVNALDILFKKAGQKSKILAEFGIGLNPYAQLCGRMLEDEGCANTVHFGFGSNITIGGLNKVAFHLDFIMQGAKVSVDGKPFLDYS